MIENNELMLIRPNKDLENQIMEYRQNICSTMKKLWKIKITLMGAAAYIDLIVLTNGWTE